MRRPVALARHAKPGRRRALDGAAWRLARPAGCRWRLPCPQNRVHYMAQPLSYVANAPARCQGHARGTGSSRRARGGSFTFVRAKGTVVVLVLAEAGYVPASAVRGRRSARRRAQRFAALRRRLLLGFADLPQLRAVLAALRLQCWAAYWARITRSRLHGSHDGGTSSRGGRCQDPTLRLREPASVSTVCHVPLS